MNFSSAAPVLASAGDTGCTPLVREQPCSQVTEVAQRGAADDPGRDTQPTLPSQMRIIIVIACQLSLASATGHTSARKSRPLLEMIASSTPAHLRGTPQEEFDCAWRPLAYEWAPVLQPWLNDTQRREIYDALLLGTKCTHHQVQTPVARSSWWRAASLEVRWPRPGTPARFLARR